MPIMSQPCWGEGHSEDLLDCLNLPISEASVYVSLSFAAMTSTLICIPNTKGNHFPLDSDYLYLYLVDMQAMHFSLLDSS